VRIFEGFVVGSGERGRRRFDEREYLLRGRVLFV
jgi:hypothetical protein